MCCISKVSRPAVPSPPSWLALVTTMWALGWYTRRSPSWSRAQFKSRAGWLALLDGCCATISARPRDLVRCAARSPMDSPFLTLSPVLFSHDLEEARGVGKLAGRSRPIWTQPLLEQRCAPALPVCTTHTICGVGLGAGGAEGAVSARARTILQPPKLLQPGT